MTMRVVPCTIRAAQKWLLQHHRHLPKVNGGRFAVAVADDTGIRGVALAGNGPRVWEGSTRMTITRVATDGAKNACSMLLGALCRAGAALGYTEAWTYTLPGEPGTSLRASGFNFAGISQGGKSHSSSKRHREPAVCPQPKQRWFRLLKGKGHD